MKFYLHLVLLCLCSWGCLRTNEQIKVEKSPSITSIQNEKSTFCIPIIISLDDIEKNVNQKIKHKLLVNKKGENNIIINVERAGHINLSGKKDKILISLPIKVTALKKTKINQFVVDFVIDVQILSELKIKSNWRIKSKSHIDNIIWRENPKLDILGFDVDIKGIVEKEVNGKRTEIARSVDQVLQKELKIKKHLDLIWHNMQKPHNIIQKSGEEAFLFIEPISVFYLSHTITKNNIVVKVKSEAEFTLLSSFDDDFRSPLPVLKNANSDCKGFIISLLAELKFADINARINTYLKGKATLIEGYNITFKKVLIRPSGQNLYVRLAIEGAAEGTVAGLVSIDVDTANHVIVGTLSRFEVLKGDIKLELADLILGDFITNELNDFGWFHYQDYMKEVPKFIKNGIERGKSGKKWHPVFDEMNTQIQRFEITDQSIFLLIDGRGEGSIVVDKLKMK